MYLRSDQQWEQRPSGSQAPATKSHAMWSYTASLGNDSTGLRVERLRYESKPWHTLAVWTQGSHPAPHPIPGSVQHETRRLGKQGPQKSLSVLESMSYPALYFVSMHILFLLIGYPSTLIISSSIDYLLKQNIWFSMSSVLGMEV